MGEIQKDQEMMRCFSMGFYLKVRPSPLMGLQYQGIRKVTLCESCGMSECEYVRWNSGTEHPVYSEQNLDTDLSVDGYSSYIIASSRALDKLREWNDHFDAIPCSLSYTYRKKKTVREGYFLLQMRKEYSFLTHGEGMRPMIDCEVCGRSSYRRPLNGLTEFSVRNHYPDGLFTINKTSDTWINENCLAELVRAFPDSFVMETEYPHTLNIPSLGLKL